MTQIERICTLLASGLKAVNVASIVGISPARISQLAKDSEEFRACLAEKTAEAEKTDIEETAITTKYHAAEHMLLDKVMEMSANAELRDLTAALRVIADRQDKAKTRLNPIVSSQAVINNVVQINLPSHALPELTLTKDMEVISVNNMNLAPLTSAGVTNLFKGMRDKKLLVEMGDSIPGGPAPAEGHDQVKTPSISYDENSYKENFYKEQRNEQRRIPAITEETLRDPTREEEVESSYG